MGRLKIQVKWVTLNFPLNNCPNCLRGKVFKGIISLNNYCEECHVIFDEDKIGDGASWISTSLLCLLSLPLALLFNFYLNVSMLTLFSLMTVVILVLTTILLRITRYLLIKKFIKLENEKNKRQ